MEPKMSSFPGRRSRGYTLVELIVVLGIIAVLIGLLLPAVQKVREAASLITCKYNLRQIVLACHHCETDHGMLPTGIGPFDRGYGTALFHLLPYLEQDPLYKQSVNGSYYAAWNNNVRSTPVKVFLCPTDPSTGSNGVVTDRQGVPWGASSYAGNAWVFGRIWVELDAAPWWREASIYNPGETYVIDPQRTARFSEIKDGLSNTILFAEKYARCVNYAYPDGGSFWAYWKVTGSVNQSHPAFGIPWNDYCIGPSSRFLVRPLFWNDPERSNCDPTLASTPHRVMNVGMLDGSVISLKPTLSGQTWWAACTPAGADLLGPDWLD
jgi:prepilin-type N-terminal cleavage/methylation domain-containing protein